MGPFALPGDAPRHAPPVELLSTAYRGNRRARVAISGFTVMGFALLVGRPL
jgi:hypothetical protein